MAAYSTDKGVVLLDRRLGILHLIIFALVLLYVIGVRVVHDKGYQAMEVSHGTASIRL